MNLISGIDVTSGALNAQKTRLDIVAQNIANAQTTRGPDGGPYQRKIVSFESELVRRSGGSGPGLQTVRDPYSGAEVYVAPAIQPDWAVLHVQEADALGNARIYGSVFWDRLMSRAARGVILTAERIVPTAELARQPELTVVPALLRLVEERPASGRYHASELSTPVLDGAVR